MTHVLVAINVPGWQVQCESWNQLASTYQPDTTAHPHDFLGYVVDDARRTKNCLRLLRGAVIGAAMTGTVVALVLWLLLQLAAAAAVVGGLTATAAVGAACFARRRRQGKRK